MKFIRRTIQAKNRRVRLTERDENWLGVTSSESLFALRPGSFFKLKSTGASVLKLR